MGKVIFRNEGQNVRLSLKGKSLSVYLKKKKYKLNRKGTEIYCSLKYPHGFSIA